MSVYLKTQIYTYVYVLKWLFAHAAAPATIALGVAVLVSAFAVWRLVSGTRRPASGVRGLASGAKCLASNVGCQAWPQTCGAKRLVSVVWCLKSVPWCPAVGACAIIAVVVARSRYIRPHVRRARFRISRRPLCAFVPLSFARARALRVWAFPCNCCCA